MQNFTKTEIELCHYQASNSYISFFFHLPLYFSFLQLLIKFLKNVLFTVILIELFRVLYVTNLNRMLLFPRVMAALMASFLMALKHISYIQDPMDNCMMNIFYIGKSLMVL